MGEGLIVVACGRAGAGSGVAVAGSGATGAAGTTGAATGSGFVAATLVTLAEAVGDTGDAVLAVGDAERDGRYFAASVPMMATKRTKHTPKMHATRTMGTLLRGGAGTAVTTARPGSR